MLRSIGCGCERWVIFRVGHGQAGEEPVQVLMRVDAAAQAAAEQAVEDGTALSGSHIADEQVVLLSKGTGPYRILHAVVIDFDFAVLEEGLQSLPLAFGVEAGFGHGALRAFFADDPLDAPAQACLLYTSPSPRD